MPKHKNINKYPQFKDLNLSEQQQDFVVAYCRPDMGYNATRAYSEAYGVDLEKDYLSCKNCAARSMTNNEIMKAIDIERARRLKKHEDIADKLIKRLDTMVDADILEMIDVVGPLVMLKDIQDVPAHLRPALKSIKVTSNGVEVTFQDKLKAIEMLGKAIGMFVDRVQNVNEDYESIVMKIDRERREGKA